MVLGLLLELGLGSHLGAVAVSGQDLEVDEVVDEGRVVLVGEVDDRGHHRVHVLLAHLVTGAGALGEG